MIVGHSPLDIKTFDGLDSPYHPSVLFLEEGWNGWRYWMAETPYSPRCPGYRDRCECPSIHVSNDGIHWQDPEGLENPIARLDAQEERDKDYYSDPHLLMNELGEMECWYRITRRHGNEGDWRDVSLGRKRSADGIHWGAQELLCPLKDNAGALGNHVVSPAVMRMDGEYRMWYVDKGDPYQQRGIAFSTSPDGIEWTEPRQITLNGPTINPWHLDVQLIEGVYWMIIYDMDSLTLWRSDDGITFGYQKLLLSPSKRIGSFYCNGLYRACLVKAGDGDFRVYFSADDLHRTYIGMMQGPSLLELVVVGEPRHVSAWRYGYLYTAKKLRTLGYLIRHHVLRMGYHG